MITQDGQYTSILENEMLRVEFSPEAGGIRSIVNKLTGERYAVSGDGFALEAASFRRAQAEMNRLEWKAEEETVSARYADGALDVEVVYELRPADHFFQKRLVVSFAADAGVRQVVVSRPVFALERLKVVCCRHPDFDWITDYVKARHGFELRRPADSEPSRTFFGRTDLGGFFTGIEMPFDNSHLEDGALALGYTPSIKIRAGERFVCEPMYFGVYRRGRHDARPGEWLPLPASAIVGRSGPGGFNGAEVAGLGGGRVEEVASARKKTLPLPSESAAMVAMTSAILGPSRHGLMAFACGWHSQMEQGEYASEAALAGELKSLGFLRECGLDGLTDSHPWAGETTKLRELREPGRYEPGPLVRRFLGRARELGLKVTQWPTMNNTHPWKEYGGPLRLDRPEWLRGVDGEALGGCNADNFLQRQANCVGCAPYASWLERVIVEDALGSGLYESWCMDGDFWGTGAYFHSTIPVTCQAENHDHLPGDANYACQRMLHRLILQVRRSHPGIYIIMCRPPEDLGVWAQHQVDACFTLIESGTGDSNIAAGDEVRTASRIRVHHQFFPHWLDQSLLFPSYADPTLTNVPAWPSEKIDYILLSALSCSPNLLMYLPTKTGIPEADKVEIRKWLDWGRANVEYLFVRKDLFDWPGKGKVDGSAHIIDDRGLIFLFNGGDASAAAEFALTAEETGFTGTRQVRIRQEFPASPAVRTCSPGEVVRWEVPSQTAVVLRAEPVRV